MNGQEKAEEEGGRGEVKEKKTIRLQKRREKRGKERDGAKKNDRKEGGEQGKEGLETKRMWQKEK